MADTRISIEPDPQEGYQVALADGEGDTVVVLVLSGAEQLSDGRLADNQQTARAVTEFLLQHQEPQDMPALVDLTDVVQVYDGAVEAIVALLP